jgi:hypothetical protein
LAGSDACPEQGSNGRCKMHFGVEDPRVHYQSRRAMKSQLDSRSLLGFSGELRGSYGCDGTDSQSRHFNPVFRELAVVSRRKGRQIRLRPRGPDDQFPVRGYATIPTAGAESARVCLKENRSFAFGAQCSTRTQLLACIHSLPR